MVSLMGVVIKVVVRGIRCWCIVIIVIAFDSDSGCGKKENCIKIYSSLYNLYRAIHYLCGIKNYSNVIMFSTWIDES